MNEVMVKKQVQIPAVPQHDGLRRVWVWLDWVCPVCGGPRGEVTQAASYDGSRRLICDGWKNPCGHVDKYSDVVREALKNGLNKHLEGK